ncbi:UNVERIFIED_CONTAM: hypothetical protein GTU68_053912 [Idotea baltica]|nr:hypothetical protein [Idotea baltica]
MNEFTLDAQLRSDLGKGASRRLRRLNNLVPAIIYGLGKEPVSISLKANEVAKLLNNEAVFSHVLTLNVEGKKESVLIKSLQRHPAKEFVMHADFIRVSANQKITTLVPLHFLNEQASIGVKQEGGEISHTLSEVEISCLPKNLPESIEVDMLEVKIGQTLHLSDIKLSKNIELTALAQGNDLAIANIHASRAAQDDTDTSNEGEAASTAE